MLSYMICLVWLLIIPSIHPSLSTTYPGGSRISKSGPDILLSSYVLQPLGDAKTFPSQIFPGRCFSWTCLKDLWRELSRRDIYQMPECVNSNSNMCQAILWRKLISATWDSVHENYNQNLWQRTTLTEPNTHWEHPWLPAENTDTTIDYCWGKIMSITALSWGVKI